MPEPNKTTDLCDLVCNYLTRGTSERFELLPEAPNRLATVFERAAPSSTPEDARGLLGLVVALRENLASPSAAAGLVEALIAAPAMRALVGEWLSNEGTKAERFRAALGASAKKCAPKYGATVPEGAIEVRHLIDPGRPQRPSSSRRPKNNNRRSYQLA